MPAVIHSCVEAAALFRPYLEGVASESEAASLEEHLKECADCRKAIERRTAYVRMLEESLKGIRVPPKFLKRSDEVLESTKYSQLVEVAGPGIEIEGGDPNVMAEMDEEGLPGTEEEEGDDDRPFIERLGAAPWWVISGTFHGLLLLLLGLLSMVVMREASQETVITTDLAKARPPEFDEKKPRDVFRNLVPAPTETPTDVEHAVVPHEQVEDTTHNETDDNMDTNTARGDPNAISDLPLGGLGTSAAMGLGGGGAGAFGQRSGGGKKRALIAGGGGKVTESAVDAALRWLARHQEEDGHWDCRKHGGTGPYDVSMTGFAVLAFLGAGHTERAGQYRDNVQRGVYWLIKQMKDDGRWNSNNYEQGIAAMALAEAAAMARVPSTREAAQKAIDGVIAGQHEYAAWNYTPNPDTNGRNDSSVSGWSVMALKSAKIGGLKVDHKGFAGAIAWLDAGQDLTGAKDAGSDYEGGKMAYAGTLQNPNKGNGSIAVTASAAMQRLFMGWKPDDPAVRGPANFFRKYPPKWEKNANGMYVGTLNLYYWYYATLVMFQVGGDHWKEWNEAMKQALIPNQRKGGDEDGSWDPVGGGGIPTGGRVMSTALGCLCLEVYYRYLPMYR